MKARSASSRRSPTVLVALALGAVLALPLSAAGAAGNATIPDNARFYKKLSGDGAITVQTSSHGVSVSAYAAPIKCTKFAPMLGSEQELAIGLSGSQHPKVGKTYVLKKSETQRGEEGEEPASATIEFSLNFKSAQLVVVKAHYLGQVGSEVSCDGGASWNVKRQS